MDLAAVLARIDEAADDCGSYAEFARICGVSDQYLSEVRKGDRVPSDKILYALGLRRAGKKIVYEFEEDR